MTDIETANRIMQQVVERMADEVGTLIGEKMESSAIEGKILATPEFSRQLKGKVVRSRLEVSKDWSGEAFLVTAHLCVNYAGLLNHFLGFVIK